LITTAVILMMRVCTGSCTDSVSCRWLQRTVSSTDEKKLLRVLARWTTAALVRRTLRHSTGKHSAPSLQSGSYRPRPLGKSWKLFCDSPGPRKSWKM